MTSAQGIGGGVRWKALLAKEKAACFEHGDQGGTVNGNPLMCAAGLEVLGEVGKARVPGNAVMRTGIFMEASYRNCPASWGSARFAAGGLLLALDLKLPIGAARVALAFESGLLLNSPQADALRLHAAINVTREEDFGNDGRHQYDPDQGRPRATGRLTASIYPPLTAPAVNPEKIGVRAKSSAARRKGHDRAAAASGPQLMTNEIMLLGTATGTCASCGRRARCEPDIVSQIMRRSRRDEGKSEARFAIGSATCGKNRQRVRVASAGPPRAPTASFRNSVMIQIIGT